MGKQYDVCILGATGAVGEAMLSILEQRKFPVRNLYPLASSRSAGSTVSFKHNFAKQTYIVKIFKSSKHNKNPPKQHFFPTKAFLLGSERALV